MESMVVVFDSQYSRAQASISANVMMFPTRGDLDHKLDWNSRCSKQRDQSTTLAHRDEAKAAVQSRVSSTTQMQIDQESRKRQRIAQRPDAHVLSVHRARAKI